VQEVLPRQILIRKLLEAQIPPLVHCSLPKAAAPDKMPDAIAPLSMVVAVVVHLTITAVHKVVLQEHNLAKVALVVPVGLVMPVELLTTTTAQVAVEPAQLVAIPKMVMVLVATVVLVNLYQFQDLAYIMQAVAAVAVWVVMDPVVLVVVEKH
jgi:hypothetical protein